MSEHSTTSSVSTSGVTTRDIRRAMREAETILYKNAAIQPGQVFLMNPSDASKLPRIEPVQFNVDRAMTDYMIRLKHETMAAMRVPPAIYAAIPDAPPKPKRKDFTAVVVLAVAVVLFMAAWAMSR